MTQKKKKPRKKKQVKSLTVGELMDLLGNVPKDTPVVRLAFGRVVGIERPEIILFNREKFEEMEIQYGGTNYASWPVLPLHTDDADDIGLMFVLNC
jgi:hypothetical protein